MMIYESRTVSRTRLRPRPAWHPCQLRIWRAVELALAMVTRWRWRSYADYLRSQVWAWKRQRALSRDGRACKLCNSRTRLQVHHREYPARWGDEPDDDLVTLCARCHQKFHGAGSAEGD